MLLRPNKGPKPVLAAPGLITRTDPTKCLPPFHVVNCLAPALPRRRPLIADLGGNDAEVAAEFKSGAQGTVSSSDAYRLEDYILPYIEDD